MIVEVQETPTQMLSRLLDIPAISDPALEVMHSSEESTFVVTFAVAAASARAKLPLASDCGEMWLTGVYANTSTLHTIGKPAAQIVTQYLATYAIGSLDLRERMYNAFHVCGGAV